MVKIKYLIDKHERIMIKIGLIKFLIISFKKFFISMKFIVKKDSYISKV